MHTPPRFIAAIGSLIALGASGCGSGSSTTTLAPHPTIIEVAPEEFLGSLVCSRAPGGVRTYVATLVDVTPAEGDAGAPADVMLPSSDLVGCESNVAFGSITVGHAYAAQIDVYDRDDLVARMRGLPEFLDPTTNAPVAPRAHTTCGVMNGEDDLAHRPTIAESEVTQRMLGCIPLMNDASPDATIVEIGIADALGDETCGDASGQIDHFVVRQDGREVGSAPCGELVQLNGFAPNAFVELEVLAFRAGETEPALGTTCSATALQGVTQSAVCAPLLADGGIDVSVDDIAAAANISCGAKLDGIALTLDSGEAKQLASSDCGGVTHFAGVMPGTHALDANVTVRGSEPFVVHCSADVEPGLVARATCAP